MKTRTYRQRYIIPKWFRTSIEVETNSVIKQADDHYQGPASWYLHNVKPLLVQPMQCHPL